MTTQTKINNIISQACDVLRDTLSAHEYGEYILSLLFVKYLSDAHKDTLEQLRAKYGEDSKRIDVFMGYETFKLGEDCIFEHLIKHRREPKIGEIINEVLRKIERSNEDKLDGIFRGIDFNSNKLGESRERAERLCSLLEVFDHPELDLRPSKLEGRDIIGDAYEYLIARFASESGAVSGQFYTPSAVSTLLAKLVAPKESSTIYDPTCGSGSLLIRAAKEIGNSNFLLYGQEINDHAHALCRMNMHLHGIVDSVIMLGDTLSSPKHVEADGSLKQFDYIVANPPFSRKWSGGGGGKSQKDPYGRFDDYAPPPKGCADYAFVLHMLKSLKKSGAMAVILPRGVLYREKSEGKIRQKLIERNLLHAIIELPNNLFYKTTIPACILVFKPTRDTTDILFIDASQDYEKGKNQNAITSEHIVKIITAYEGYASIDKYAYRASREEIEANEYDCYVSLYVDRFDKEEEIDIDATREQIARLESNLEQRGRQMADYLAELGL